MPSDSEGAALIQPAGHSPNSTSTLWAVAAAALAVAAPVAVAAPLKKQRMTLLKVPMMLAVISPALILCNKNTAARMPPSVQHHDMD